MKERTANAMKCAHPSTKQPACGTCGALPVVMQLDSGPVDVDTCIALIVRALNAEGIQTVASCCGHGHRPGNIVLHDGRELIIARNFDEARRIDGLFPLDIHGDEVGAS